MHCPGVSCLALECETRDDAPIVSYIQTTAMAIQVLLALSSLASSFYITQALHPALEPFRTDPPVSSLVKPTKKTYGLTSLQMKPGYFDPVSTSATSRTDSLSILTMLLIHGYFLATSLSYHFGRPNPYQDKTIGVSIALGLVFCCFATIWNSYVDFLLDIVLVAPQLVSIGLGLSLVVHPALFRMVRHTVSTPSTHHDTKDSEGPGY